MAVYSASSAEVPAPSKNDMTVRASSGLRARRFPSAGMPLGVIS